MAKAREPTGWTELSACVSQGNQVWVPEMASNSNSLEPGIYAADERRLTDAQIEAMVDYVISKPDLWARLKHIKGDEILDMDLARRIMHVEREFVVRGGLVMCSQDLAAATISLRERIKNRE